MNAIFTAITATVTLFNVGVAAAEEFKLTSPDVAQGQSITGAQYWNNFGCIGDNERPDLNWSGAPDGTKSFAVTFYDNDAPTGSGFWHWVIYDIPATATGIGGDADPLGAVEGNTDVGVPGYAGPCPPVGRIHTYTYTVHALKSEKLDVPNSATAPLTGFFLYQNTIAKATLDVTAGPRSE